MIDYTNKCPCCGLEREPDDADIYECIRCGNQGFDCCVPGNRAICSRCEDEDAEASQ